jgi:hypothetical protein
MKPLIFICCFITSLHALAGDPKFPVSAIPETLKKDVDVIVREDQVIYTVIAINQGKMYSHYVVTILNEKGSDYARKTISYDKLTKIGSLSANVYDASGESIKRLKKSDIYDQSSFDGFSLFSDDRFKSMNLSQSTYPYTVEFEYEIEYGFLYHIDGSYFIPDEKASVQHVSYQLIFPTELKPRWKTFNMQITPAEEKTKDGMTMMTWEMKELLPIKSEPMAPRNSFIPYIEVAPCAFEYSGYRGNMTSWEDYGKWQSLLNQGRDAIPEATKSKLKELTASLQTNEEKIKAVYEFLQGKTRYVSVQLGIGGLQPIPASVVDQMGYGDCKALSNYMVAMLKEIGIKGYYTTVMAGKNVRDVVEDFPSHQGNHVIVAVPNEKDTIWLECTSQRTPFGYMGTFTGNRKALMITEAGGILVNTPRYNAETNTSFRSAAVKLSNTGDATAVIKTVYSGLSFETQGLHGVFDSPDDQKKWVQETTEIPSFDLNSFLITEVRNRIPSATVDLNLTLKRLATVSGKRIFITPNLMNRVKFIPEKVENRKTNVVRRSAYTEIDTIRYALPEEVYPEFLPEPVNQVSKFGEYSVTYKMDQGSLVYIRKLKMQKGVFPPESYNDLIEFFKKISKSDATKLVFLSKT